jgi:hypothetical protein
MLAFCRNFLRNYDLTTDTQRYQLVRFGIVDHRLIEEIKATTSIFANVEKFLDAMSPNKVETLSTSALASGKRPLF